VETAAAVEQIEQPDTPHRGSVYAVVLVAANTGPRVAWRAVERGGVRCRERKC